MVVTAKDVSFMAYGICVINTLARDEKDVLHKDHLMQITDRMRKIYILLLETSTQGRFNLSAICDEGVADDSDGGKAIQTLCPMPSLRRAHNNHKYQSVQHRI